MTDPSANKAVKPHEADSVLTEVTSKDWYQVSKAQEPLHPVERPDVELLYPSDSAYSELELSPVDSLCRFHFGVEVEQQPFSGVHGVALFPAAHGEVAVTRHHRQPSSRFW